jgi:hypothetical protein
MTSDIDELETTLDQPLLAPHDHTLLLKAVQVHSPNIVALMGGAKARLSPDRVLRAIAALPKADAKTKQTANQVLTFLPMVIGVELPASYAATLVTFDQAMAETKNPMAVVMALSLLKDNRSHDRVAGFQIGVGCALDLLGDALGTAGTMMSGVTVFGKRRPGDIARNCARGCVFGALAGSVNKVPPSVAGVVGGVAGSTTALIAAYIEAP